MNKGNGIRLLPYLCVFTNHEDDDYGYNDSNNSSNDSKNGDNRKYYWEKNVLKYTIFNIFIL